MLPFMPVLGALWGNQWTRLAGVALFAAAFGFYKGFAAVPRVDVAAVVRNAEAGRDAYWQSRLNEQEEQARQAVDAAIEAGAHVAVASDADLVQLCAKSSACRDRK